MSEERALQAAVFDFLRVALPRGALAFAIPNGDGRVTTMPGTLSGIPDICVVYQGRAIFIELKAKKGRLHGAQPDVHKALVRVGAVVTTCRSVEAVQDFLSQIIPLRARVAA